MSLLHHFVASARESALIVPGAPGAATSSSGAYGLVMAQARRRQAIVAGLLAGKPGPAGTRVDAAGQNARADADGIARSMLAAEYLAQAYPHNGNAAKQFADGAAFVRSCFDQLYPASRNDGARAHVDATVPMASQGLAYILPEVYEYAHNSLPCWDGEVLKIDRRGDPAAERIVWYEMDNVGLARAGSTYDVTTIPMVAGPLAADNQMVVVPALVGMETNFMDARREALAVRNGKPDFNVEAMKRQACQTALAEFFDNLWFGGDATMGVDGLFNNPAVETVGIAGAWSGKTALQINADLNTMAWTIYNRTGGQLGDFGRVRIILPPDAFRLLSQPITSAGSATILEYFNNYWKSGNGGQTRGVPKIELQARFAAANSYAYNGGPNILTQDTGVILYEDGNPNVDPTFVLTQPIEVPAPVRQTGVGDVTYFHARGSGMRMPDARRVKYVVGF